MPPTPQKPLSPAELAKLEHAFATDPQSEAYRPLAEAYLGMGRFMEAMVVCKKGVKAHPTTADPRVLLARVYAEQGKDKKALEELQNALQVAPKDKAALRLTGSLQIKGGEADGGKSNLLKAYELDPNDAATLELMKQHGVALPSKAAAPPPVQSAPPVLQHQQPSPNGARGNGAQAQVQQHAPPQHQAPAQHHAPAQQQQQQQQRPRPKTIPPRRPAYTPEESQSGVSELSGEYSQAPRRSGKKGGSATLTIAILILAIAGGGGFAIWKQYDSKTKGRVNLLLRQAAGELKHDSYDSYKKAIEAADEALSLRSDSVAAHGILAYAHAIRWGEHGGGDEDRKAAEEHLAAGLKIGDKSSWLYAADGLVPFYSGNSREALDHIANRIEQTGGKSAQLFLTQGIIMMNDGDLDGAREAMEKAQQITQDDARVYAAFGMLNRRRGLDREALQNFETATRFEKNHVDSIIGTATIVLDQDNPALGYITAAKNIKAIIDQQPPPSPRQLALAQVVKGLMISRVSNDLPLYEDPEFQKKLQDGTGVGKDKDKNRSDGLAAEAAGFNLDKNNPELLLVKGKRLFFEGNVEAAATEIRKARDANPARVHYHIELGKVLMAKEGKEKEAEAEIRKGLTAVPGNMKLQTMLGSILYREKRIDDAITVLEVAVKPAREAGTRQRNPEAFYMLGKIYRDEKKDITKAIDNMSLAANQSFANPAVASRIYDELSLLLEQKGDKGAAQANWEKSLNADPENDAAICHYVKSMAGDPKRKDQIKVLAKKYVEVAPKGECVAEMRGLM